LTLHILNLITPLTPPRTNAYTTPHVASVNVRKVDITAPGIRSVLQALVDASSASLEPSDGDSSESDEDSTTPLEFLVKIPPPIYIRVLPPAHLLPARIGLLEGEHLTGRRSTGEWLESFMSSWTRLVGDPILSKWIVVVLAISISLNGYLLKGIALGVGVRAFGVVGRSGVVKGGVRFDEAEEVQQQQPTTTTTTTTAAAVVVTRLAPASPTRGPASPAPAPSSVATFTLEDVDRRLKATKRLSSTSTKPPVTCTPPLSSSDSDPSSSSDNEGPQEAKPDVVRSLEECVDVFENGPRPQSVALSMLNDEEVVLLAQHGKIAAYALEKVLGMDELERAVRIRRALICMSLFFFLFFFGVC
jgi:hydroxymethylglutaryl-CoA reductase (NADPH)